MTRKKNRRKGSDNLPNPLNLELSTGLQSKVERVPAEIVSIDELEEMSLAEVQRAKKQLGERRKRIQLMLDGEKLKQAKQIMSNMSLTLNAMTKKLLLDDVPANDVKALANAYSEMVKSLNNVSRLDSVDGTGKAAMLSIEVRYKEA